MSTPSHEQFELDVMVRYSSAWFHEVFLRFYYHFDRDRPFRKSQTPFSQKSTGISDPTSDWLLESAIKDDDPLDGGKYASLNAR